MTKNPTILLAACLCLTVLSGILRGKIDNRWGAKELNAAAEAVNSIPESLGSWKAEKIEHLDEGAVTMLRCSGNVVGNYASRDGGIVSMIYLVGPSGPLAVHTPDVCYGSNNFDVDEPTRTTTIIDVEGNEHEFSVITFRENGVGNRLLRVYFAWNKNGEWVAPETPRTAFAGVPMLYKIQVATHDVEKDEQNLDAGERFLRETLPLLKEVPNNSAKQ